MAASRHFGGFVRGMRLLVAAGALMATTAGAEDVGLRCAAHDSYDRLVFEVPAPEEVAVWRSTGQFRLGWSPDWTLVGEEACRRDLAALQGWARTEAFLIGQIAPPEQQVRSFTISDPPRLVVDIGDVPASMPDSPPLPPLVAEPAPLPPLIPPEPSPALAALRQRVANGDLNPVVRLLEQRLSSEAGLSATLRFYLADLYERQGRRLAAARVLWQTGRANPEHPAARKALLDAATIFEEQGFPYEAAKPLQAFLRSYPLDPGSLRVQLRLGRLQALAGEAGSAREDLIPLTYRAAGALRERAEIWLAYILADEGRFDVAAQDFKRFRRTNEAYFRSHPALLFKAAQVALEQGQYEQAIEDLGLFERQYPNHPRRMEAAILRGRAEGRRGNWSAARPHFQRVVDAGRQADVTARARTGLVEADYRLNRETLDRAVDKLTAIAQSMPYSQAAREARLTAARLLADQNRNADALEQLGTIMQQGNQADRQRVQSLADRLLPEEMDRALEADQPFRAFSLFARFAGAQPPGATARRAYQALLQLGAFRNARKFLQAFAERVGPTIEEKRWQWQLAQAYAEAGPASEGATYVADVLSNDPGHPFAQRLRLVRARLLNQAGDYARTLTLLDRYRGLPAAEAAWLRAMALKGQGEQTAAYRVLSNHLATAEGEAQPARIAEAGDLAAQVGRIYAARRYWKRALDGGLDGWQANQVLALLGVDAVQRADFQSARRFLASVDGDGTFAEVAATYQEMIPLMREQLL